MGRALLALLLVLHLAAGGHCVAGVDGSDVILIAQTQLGVREETGHNDGYEVGQYLASVSLGEGPPWCAAFVHWCFRQLGYAFQPQREFAMSGRWVSERVVWRQGQRPTEIKPGDVFGIYFPRLGRIGHTGFVLSADGGHIETIEANTNSAGSREGDGVYRKRRPLSQIKRISRWL